MIYKWALVKTASAKTKLALKALGEPRRVQILELLRACPRSVSDIADAVDVTQQAASQHLAVLDRAGLVEARREGTRNVYAIRPAGFAPVESFVRAFWKLRLGALAAEIEKK